MRGPFGVSGSIEEPYAKGAEYRDFLSNFLSHSTEKFGRRDFFGVCECLL